MSIFDFFGGSNQKAKINRNNGGKNNNNNTLDFMRVQPMNNGLNKGMNINNMNNNFNNLANQLNNLNNLNIIYHINNNNNLYSKSIIRVSPF